MIYSPLFFWLNYPYCLVSRPQYSQFYVLPLFFCLPLSVWGWETLASLYICHVYDKLGDLDRLNLPNNFCTSQFHSSWNLSLNWMDLNICENFVGKESHGLPKNLMDKPTSRLRFQLVLKKFINYQRLSLSLNWTC